jgi:YfiR/HmsC-like
VVLEGSDSNQVVRQFSVPKGTSLITFGETEGFLQAGGVIQIMDLGEHLQFGVNLDAARDAGIRIDARLLGLAKCVVKAGELDGR